MAGDVEYRLNLVIQEAQKFMRHAKRTTMVPGDIDYALQALNVQVSARNPSDGVGRLVDDDGDMTDQCHART